MRRTGARVYGALHTCLTGSRGKCCACPLVHREPLLLVNPPKVNGATVVRRTTTRYNIKLMTCAVARRAHRDTVNLPRVIGQGCNKGKVVIASCAVDRVITSICSYVRGANEGRKVLFVSRVGYISRALTPTVLTLLRGGAFKDRGVPRN